MHYLLLEGVNDSMDDLAGLEGFCRGFDAGVNLLRYNDTDGAPFAPSPFGTALVWAHLLRQHGIRAHVIAPRGDDIAAACGQPRNRLA